MALFLLLSLGFATVVPTLASMGLRLLLLELTVPYIVHYFRLENGVQRWYHLQNRIDAELGRVSQSYEGK